MGKGQKWEGEIELRIGKFWKGGGKLVMDVEFDERDSKKGSTQNRSDKVCSYIAYICI